MTDGTRPTRRRLLGWVAGAGALGFLGHRGTTALLEDSEGFDGTFATRGVDLEVADATGDGTANYGDSSVALDFEDLSPDAKGTAEIGIRSCVDPARVWMRLRARQNSSEPLLDALHVTLSRRSAAGDETQLFDGTAAGLAGAFGGGTMLEDCVKCEPTTLAIDWRMQSSDAVEITGEAATLGVTFAGRRCDDDRATPENPWQ